MGRDHGPETKPKRRRPLQQYDAELESLLRQVQVEGRQQVEVLLAPESLDSDLVRLEDPRPGYTLPHSRDSQAPVLFPSWARLEGSRLTYLETIPTRPEVSG